MAVDATLEPGTAAPTRLRVAAWLCIVAGVLGVVGGVALALVEPAVSEDRFSYPQSTTAFTLTQAWFAIHHLGLLAGLVALRWSDALPATRPARTGWLVAVLGMVGLTVTELLAIAAADADTDSTAAIVVGAAYGIDCTALGLGLVVAGLSIWRAHTWSGWRRGVVLLMGVWVFVPMFPALALTPTDGARLAIGGWMLLFAALGVALLSGRSEPGRASPAG